MYFRCKNGFSCCASCPMYKHLKKITLNVCTYLSIQKFESRKTCFSCKKKETVLCCRLTLAWVPNNPEPRRKSHWGSGILLWWHNCDMRSPRALVMRRECIVAVFKTWRPSTSAAAAQWMQALESWLELAPVNNVNGIVRECLTAGCWTWIRGTLGEQLFRQK